NGTGTIDGSNLTAINGTTTEILQALTDMATDPTNFNSTLTAGAETATNISTLAGSNGTGTIDGSNLTAINGTVAAVLQALTDMTTDPTSFNSTLTDASVSVANANLVDAATTGVITATITETAAATLITLTGSGNAYTITVTDASVAAADLNTIDAATTIAVNAIVVSTLTGTASAVVTALGSTGIVTSSSYAVTLSAGSAAAADLITIDNDTSGNVNASLVSTITGTVANVLSVINSAGITTAATYNVTLAAGTTTATDLIAIDSDNGVGTVDATLITSITGTAADLATVFSTITGVGSANVTITDAVSIANVHAIDLLTTGMVTVTTVSDSGSNVDSNIADLHSAGVTASAVTISSGSAVLDVSEATGLVFTQSGGTVTILDTATNIQNGIAAIVASQITTVDSSDDTVSLTKTQADSLRSASVHFDSSDALTITGSTGATLAGLTFSNYNQTALGGTSSVILDASNDSVSLTYSQASSALSAGVAFHSGDALIVSGVGSQLVGLATSFTNTVSQSVNIDNLGGPDITFNASDDAATLSSFTQYSNLLTASVLFDTSDVITYTGSGVVSLSGVGGADHYNYFVTGDSTITGGAGSDNMQNLLGSVINFTGGAGADDMKGGTGGTGTDTFIFHDGDTGAYNASVTNATTALANGVDVIRDFGTGDHIDLSNITGLTSAAAISADADGIGVAQNEIYLQSVNSGADTLVLINTSGGVTGALTDFDVAIYVTGTNVDHINDFILP
ncbi:MAG: hypothetical protein H7832_09045, partial [Magnetococcus sp. DMHC-6]